MTTRGKYLAQWLVISLMLIFLVSSVYISHAQNELAATLEVLSPGVEVRRVNTTNWIEIRREAIVGVGDDIRTNSTGRARITFFTDGTTTEILPETEYRILQFEGTAETFQLSVEVLLGRTLQRLGRLLDANSSYDVNTPEMKLAARGTQFAIRVETNGRAAMLVSEGAVDATAEQDTANVPPGFGVRAQDRLSEVVRATTFEQLDAALDGCTAVIPTTEDISLNVRTGPGLEFEKIGTLEPAEITLLMGVVEAGNWYRISFQGGFAWIRATNARIDPNCAGLRRFPDDYGPESTTNGGQTP